jgi:hypothetical protein
MKCYKHLSVKKKCVCLSYWQNGRAQILKMGCYKRIKDKKNVIDTFFPNDRYFLSIRAIIVSWQQRWLKLVFLDQNNNQSIAPSSL